ncbi:ankyrin repeat protein [Pandoravirus inopinatum]|uniref:Ankyrin repeat protein n=1 Tax=Pandoravirus inopinatum TaxID=1605721 RepID=A0A0B5J6T2_9VIRU|nr:ankyrin repeat protein [Pandoravirus inopinatum]AJF97495.1 ankyrin repeat protein [Pandoravirus inopinatum]
MATAQTAVTTARGLTINDLPLELIDALLAFVAPLDRVVCTHVSRTWRTIIIGRAAKRRPEDPSKVDFLSATVCAGHWHLVEWARDCGCPWNERVAVAAIDAGRGDFFSRLVSLGCPVQPRECLVAAAAKGDLASLRLTVAMGRVGRSDGEAALDAAASAGQTHILSWLCLHGHGCNAVGGCWTRYVEAQSHGDVPSNTSLCLCAHSVGRRAARGGHTDTLAWLHKNGCGFDGLVMAEAAEGGHIGTMIWLYDKGVEFVRDACYWAAEAGQLDALKWLRANGCPWDEGACLHAAYGGHLDTLQWAMANGCPWDPLATTFAAIGGHLDVAEWTLGQGCALFTENDYGVVGHPSLLAHSIYDNTVMDIAARGGRIDVLAWLSAHGCRAEAYTFAAAAENGHLDVIDWLHTHSRPWDEDAYAMVASVGSLAVLQHMHARGCPWDERVCTNIAHRGRLDMLQWARANGCPWNRDTMCRSARIVESLSMLQWLVAQGCRWDDHIAVRAVASSAGNLDLLVWIVKSGRSWNMDKCLNKARRHGRRHIVTWIEAYRAMAARPLCPPEPIY